MLAFFETPVLIEMHRFSFVYIGGGGGGVYVSFIRTPFAITTMGLMGAIEAMRCPTGLVTSAERLCGCSAASVESNSASGKGAFRCLDVSLRPSGEVSAWWRGGREVKA